MKFTKRFKILLLLLIIILVFVFSVLLYFNWIDFVIVGVILLILLCVGIIYGIWRILKGKPKKAEDKKEESDMSNYDIVQYIRNICFDKKYSEITPDLDWGNVEHMSTPYLGRQGEENPFAILVVKEKSKPEYWGFVINLSTKRFGFSKWKEVLGEKPFEDFKLELMNMANGMAKQPQIFYTIKRKTETSEGDVIESERKIPVQEAIAKEKEVEEDKEDL